MHFLDYLIMAMLAYNGFVGLRQGAVRMINGILGILIATSLSKTIFEKTFDQFSHFIPFFITYPFLYFGVCFIALLLICQVLAQFLHTIFQWSGMGLLNHISGLILGSFRGIIIVLIIIIPLMLVKPDFAMQSSLVHKSSPVIRVIIDYLNESGFFQDLFKSLYISPDSITLPQGNLT
ncbi:hypothetical protein DID74_01050 [Candidatus Marinamargulisbacteria bacterium SCGC AG-333-B06]|nr:hypothetical protein DID74_01050 [Candidatus Marinamargulisbacteria bacterium SCGC AG-333-B06]